MIFDEFSALMTKLLWVEFRYCSSSNLKVGARSKFSVLSGSYRKSVGF